MLADKLIMTGLGVSHKDKDSQKEKINEMVKMLKADSIPVDKLEHVVRFSCERLKKMGYTYKASNIIEKLKGDDKL